MKQSKLRRRRVVRFAILYFVLLVVFLGLIIGPAVAGKNIPSTLLTDMSPMLSGLVQPVGFNNNDTRGWNQTGTGFSGYTGVLKTASTSGRSTATSR
jgi:1,3-beta-glucan synthase